MELYHNFFTEVLKQDSPPCPFPLSVHKSNFSYASTSEDDDEPEVGEMKTPQQTTLFTHETPHEGIDVYISNNVPSDQFVCYLNKLWHIRLSNNLFVQYAVNWDKQQLDEKVIEEFKGDILMVKIFQRYQKDEMMITRIVSPYTGELLAFHVGTLDWKNYVVWYNEEDQNFVVRHGDQLSESLQQIFSMVISKPARTHDKHATFQVVKTQEDDNDNDFITCYYVEEDKSKNYSYSIQFTNGQLVFSKAVVHSLHDPNRKIFQQIVLPSQFTFPTVRTSNWNDDVENELISVQEGMYLEGMQCVGLDPSLHLNVDKYDNNFLKRNQKKMLDMTLDDDFDVFFNLNDTTIHFSSFPESNTLQHNLSDIYLEPAYHSPNKINTPLLCYDYNNSVHTNSDHFVDVLESDATQRIRGSRYPLHILEMYRLFLQPYKEYKYLTGFTDKLISGGSMMTIAFPNSKHFSFLSFELSPIIELPQLINEFSSLNDRYSSQNIGKIRYALGCLGLYGKLFWRTIRYRKQTYFKSNFCIKGWLLSNFREFLRYVKYGMRFLHLYFRYKDYYIDNDTIVQNVQNCLPRYQPISFTLENETKKAQVFIDQYGQGTSSHRHVVHVQGKNNNNNNNNSNVQFTSIQETSQDRNNNSDWTVDEKNSLNIGLSENENQIKQTEGNLYVAKYAVTEENKPCIILLHIPPYSKVFPGKMGDKGRASDVTPVWIKSYQVKENNKIVFDEEERYVNGSLCDYCDEKVAEPRWANQVAYPCKHKACVECWNTRTECMKCRKPVQKFYEIKKIKTPILHAFSDVYNDKQRFKYTVNQPLHEPNFHPDRNRMCIEGTPGFYFNVSFQNNFNWMKGYNTLSPGEGWKVLNEPEDHNSVELEIKPNNP